MPQFFSELGHCVAPIPVQYGIEDDVFKSDDSGEDHHCKTYKMKHLDRLLESIQTRVEAWLEYVKQDPGVRGLQALFTQEEISKATPYVPRWPLFVQLAAGVIMMGFSSYYHLFLCESYEASQFLRCLDLVGITVMIAGSATSPFYYGFYCEEMVFWGRLWLGTMYLFCFVAGFLTLYYRKDMSKKNLNAASFIVAGYSSLFGIIHLGYYSGP